MIQNDNSNTQTSSNSANEGGAMTRTPWPPTVSNKNKLILHECASYIVLNKPCDFHMDGTHSQTVHKLLTFWYPSPILIAKAAMEETDLAEIVSTTLHLWNSLPDYSLRNCHQIDYATSGCLLVARSRKAAAVAAKAFEDRRVEKTYVAVVVGHVHFNSADASCASTANRNSTSEWFTATQTSVHILKQEFDQHWGSSEIVNNNNNNRNSSCNSNCNGKEQKYRKKRKEQATNGPKVIGFLPVYAVFVKWQSAITKYYSTQKEHNAIRATNDTKETSPLATSYDDAVGLLEEHHQVVTILGGGGCQIPVPRFAENKELEKKIANRLTTKWKDVKKQATMEHIVLKFEELCDKYNASLVRIVGGENAMPPPTRKEQRKWNHVQQYNKDKLIVETAAAEIVVSSSDFKEDLPTVFHVVTNDCSGGFDTCYINASIADLKPDFRMTIHPDAMKTHKDARYRKKYTTYSSRNLDDLDFKPALTKCTVLWRGFLNSSAAQDSTAKIPVTKVLLQPRTGRRHQLRLHMVALGHPILGDYTYEYHPPTNQKTANTPSTRSYSARMCLHAHKLALPLLGFSSSNEVMPTFIAKDPFQSAVNEKDGDETLVIDSPQQW